LTQKYLQIALPVPLRRCFEYSLPEVYSKEKLVLGARIKVPFGRQVLIGILLEVGTISQFDPNKVKPILEILDSESIFHPNILSICRWAANYYQHPIGDVLHSALPVLLRHGESNDLNIDYLVLKDPPAESLSKSPRQLALYKLLTKNKFGLTRYDLRQAEFSLSIINSLIKKRLVEWQSKRQVISEFVKDNIRNEQPLCLNSQQSAALKKLDNSGTHLIFGITGSGKTEIYLQAIEEVILAGKQALVLVPEIGLTPQTVERFRSRFSSLVCVLHSGLSDKERLQAWRQAKHGGAAIIIGTRSAIFTPLKNPGIIIIDEEHDPSFKQQEGFRYSARDIAVLRGQLESIPVVLGSATPSLESFNNASKEKYTLSLLTERPKAIKDTQYKLIGTQHEKLNEGFSSGLIAEIKSHLEANNQVMIFLNRRGFSPVILCRDCGWIAECTRCDARMTYHQTLRKLICHHCGTQTKVHQRCGACQSTQLVPLGLGTQRIEQTLNAIFPEQNIIRIDRDSTRKKGSFEQIMDDIKQGNPAILVGTQLLAKGHHFPDVTLVAIVDMDAGFYSADYRAIERMGQLLLQVGGRAGRESKPGTVVIQTQFPDQPILKTLISDGYQTFCQQLLDDREQYKLPPFTFQALIRAEANSTGLALQFLSDINENNIKSPGFKVLGPVPSSMEKRAGKHRAQLLLTSTNRRSLQKGLSHCITLAEQSKQSRRVRWSVDVDPIDLF
jgi:primosomal protein N' (replication factor Y)